MSTELAWSAGFFDGEGTIVTQFRKTEGKSPRASLSVYQNDPEELNRFMNAVGDGKIYGPYTRSPSTWKPFYQYTVTGTQRVASVLNLLWPYLCSRKKAQARYVFKTLDKEEWFENLTS